VRWKESKKSTYIRISGGREGRHLPSSAVHRDVHESPITSPPHRHLNGYFAIPKKLPGQKGFSSRLHLSLPGKDGSVYLALIVGNGVVGGKRWRGSEAFQGVNRSFKERKSTAAVGRAPISPISQGDTENTFHERGNSIAY